MRSGPAIQFHYLAAARFPVGAARKTLAQLFRKHKRKGLAVNYIFCSDKYLLEINRTYLGHDYYTDIVTFDLSDSASELRADVFISIDRVKENAREIGIPIYRELLRVILHGALHLVGYRDKGLKEKESMREAEDLYLKKLLKNVPRET